MRNRNTLSCSKYVWENLYFSVLVFMLYCNTLFRPLSGYPFKNSLYILAGVVIINLGVSIFLTFRRRRNNTSILCNQFLGYGCYFMLSLWASFKRFFICILLIALTLSVLYSLLVIVSYCHDIKKRPIVGGLRKCLSSCVMNSRTIVAFVLAVVLLFFMGKSIIGLPLMEAPDDRISNETEDLSSEGETIAKNIDTVLLLQEEEWAKLDVTARLAVMKTVADIEAHYLGIPELTVGADVLEDDTLGQYNDATKTITINLNRLMDLDAQHMLFAMCHECYHAYQHRLVELYDNAGSDYQDLFLFIETVQYKEEFANYIDGYDDYTAYDNQLCEVESDRYASDSIRDYYFRISEYNEEHNIEN